MKKINLFILIIVMFISISCVTVTHPVLESKEYKIIDTLKVNYSNFNYSNFNDIIGANIIIKYDSTYHYGVLNKYGNLIEMNPRNLKLPIKK